MISVWKRGLCLIALSCCIPVAIADLHVGGVTGKAESGVADSAPKKPRSSADFLFRMDATPEEDYQAGIVAYDRNELIESQGIFERAAKKGHTGAMVRLADLLDRAGFVAEAAGWYMKAAEAGNADAQYKLGSMYMDLNAYDLTKSGVKTDPVTARKWLVRAAEQGNPESIKLVADAYITGGLGLTEAEQTDAEVLKWIDIAIEKISDPDAMEALAVIYRKGKFGFEANKQLADEWVAKARFARGIKEEEVQKKRKQRVY